MTKCLCKRNYPRPEDRDKCPIHGVRIDGKPYWDGGRMKWCANPVWPSQEREKAKAETRDEIVVNVNCESVFSENSTINCSSPPVKEGKLLEFPEAQQAGSADKEPK